MKKTAIAIALAITSTTGFSQEQWNYSSTSVEAGDYRRATEVCLTEFGTHILSAREYRSSLPQMTAPEWVLTKTGPLKPYRRTGVFDTESSTRGKEDLSVRNFIIARSGDLKFPTGNKSYPVACNHTAVGDNPHELPSGRLRIDVRVTTSSVPVNKPSLRAAACIEEFGELATVTSTQTLNPYLSSDWPMEVVQLATDITVSPKGKVMDAHYGTFSNGNSKRFDVLLISGNGETRFPESLAASYRVACDLNRR